jgi:glucose dehydrogenase
LGGSWYYVLAGIAFALAGLQNARSDAEAVAVALTEGNIAT